MDTNSTAYDYTEETFPKTALNFPPSGLELIGLFVIVFVSALASAGGLGGGGMQTPFLMIFFKLSIFECVPLANLFGLLATGTRFLINYR